MRTCDVCGKVSRQVEDFVIPGEDVCLDCAGEIEEIRKDEREKSKAVFEENFKTRIDILKKEKYFKEKV
jgi:hypothetical protein